MVTILQIRSWFNKNSYKISQSVIDLNAICHNISNAKTPSPTL